MKTNPLCTSPPTTSVWCVRYTSLAAFLLGALPLVVPSGYSIGSAMLLLGSVVLLWRRPMLGLERADAVVMAALTVSALIGMIWAGWVGEGWRDVDKPVRFLLAVPALLLVMAYPPRLAWLWSGLALGAIGAGGWAIWQRFGEGVPRASGDMNPIQYGNLSMLLGVLCLAGLGWAVVQRHRHAWTFLISSGAALGVLASLLSGSRGGWVGVPFILLVLYRAYGRDLSMRLALVLSALLVVALIVVYQVEETGVENRVTQAVSNIDQYFSGGNRNTSVGMRFEMWKGAAHLIIEKPLSGWGENGYRPAMQELADQGVIESGAAKFGHAHNEYLDVFAKRGVLGFLSLMALYLVPLTLFVRGFSMPDLSRRSVAVAGALLSVTYIDFSLTQAFLAHNSGTMMYAFLLAVLWGGYRSKKLWR
ncbi:MAG: O-antigen ligase family protein [Pseudomonadota bacterium]